MICSSPTNSYSLRETGAFILLCDKDHNEHLPRIYQRALDFLVTNEPEQCLEVQLPLHKYEELERYADSLYDPEVDYDTKTSTAIINTAPCSTNQRFEETARVWRILRQATFGGYNSRTSKVPDDGLVYFLTTEEVLTVAIEMGVSEKYEKLLKDAYL
ncbi:hypothetical protein V1515DRAFT_542176 [Lipomyces mesembrius]